MPRDPQLSFCCFIYQHHPTRDPYISYIYPIICPIWDPYISYIFTQYTPLYHHHPHKGPSPWTSRPGRVVRNMRRRKRRQKRLKLKAFGQSTSTVGEENVNRYRFELGFSSGDVQTTFCTILKLARLNRFPWLCSLKESGFAGKHRCGVTLLSGS